MTLLDCKLDVRERLISLTAAINAEDWTEAHDRADEVARATRVLLVVQGDPQAEPMQGEPMQEDRP